MVVPMFAVIEVWLNTGPLSNIWIRQCAWMCKDFGVCLAQREFEDRYKRQPLRWQRTSQSWLAVALQVLAPHLRSSKASRTRILRNYVPQLCNYARFTISHGHTCGTLPIVWPTTEKMIKEERGAGQAASTVPVHSAEDDWPWWWQSCAPGRLVNPTVQYTVMSWIFWSITFRFACDMCMSFNVLHSTHMIHHAWPMVYVKGRMPGVNRLYVYRVMLHECS